MKHLLLIIPIVMVCSCKPKPKASENGAPENIKQELAYTIPEDSILDATAIIWVDRKEKREHERTRTKILKAKATVSKEGKITIINFVKNYPKEEQLYIKHKLLNFKVDKNMMDYGYIKPGEQFMQFRFIVNRLEEKSFLH